MLTPAAHELPGMRVLVMGLGLFGGGVGAVRFLAKHGARVTVTDLKTAEQLAESVRALEGLPVEFHLGSHRDSDLDACELLLISPAVAPDNSFLREAVKRGIPVETELNLFVKLCRAPILGITGSNGKTTTTALVEAATRRMGGPTWLPTPPGCFDRPKRVWVGGNIGRSLLADLDEIQPNDAVVLEISSFQLENLAAIGRFPAAGLVTNLQPNHLDRHGTMEAYGDAKKNVLRGRGSVGIVNADCPIVGKWASTASNPLTFGRKAPVGRGACLSGGWISIADNGDAHTILPASALRIPGLFNVENALAAACASWVLGATKDGIAQGFAEFRGCEHRLESFGTWGGVTWINDSIATNPDSTLAALRTLSQPLILILGGHDKGLPFEDLARAVSPRCRAVVLLGSASAKIGAALEAAGCSIPVDRAKDLGEAVAMSAARARTGDAVLLSPACASFDQFRNFEDRGKQFKALAQEATAGRAEVEEMMASAPRTATA
ncbi:MAG: UDP-N-acetylmuramoyl-L-alanine--D-glutamate ligase [Planctomycetota bacterium]